MPPTIRRMQPPDHAVVHNLWQACGLSEEPEDGRAEMGAFLAAPQSAGFIAEADGAVVGAVLCGSDGRYGYIHHLAVAAAHRQRGLGRALVAACRAFLQHRHILVLVREGNAPGQAFWRGADFRPVDGLQVQFIDTQRPPASAVNGPTAGPRPPA